MSDLASWTHPITFMLNLMNLVLGLFSLWLMVSLAAGSVRGWLKHGHGHGGKGHRTSR